ncbi:MAG: hypothetical protein ACE5IQ_00880 [Candidatus Methylomirabilales bacterium]
MSDGFPLYEKGLETKNTLQYDKVDAVFRDESLLAQAQRGATSQRSVRSIWDTLIQVVRPIEGVLQYQEKNRLIDQTKELFLSTRGGASVLEGLNRFTHITKIVLGFGDRFVTNQEDGVTLGRFHPAKRSKKYRVTIIYQFDLSTETLPGETRIRTREGQRLADGERWPNTRGGSWDCNIRYTHTQGKSRMAVVLFHELLHIWFVNTNWKDREKLGPFITGHADVMQCQIVRTGFHDLLTAFYAEIDGIEGRQK